MDPLSGVMLMLALTTCTVGTIAGSGVTDAAGLALASVCAAVCVAGGVRR